MSGRTAPATAAPTARPSVTPPAAARADLHRLGPFDSTLLGPARTAPTRTSSPATASSPGRQRHAGQDLRRPRRRRLPLLSPPAPAKPRTSAMAPAPGSAAAGHRHDPRTGGNTSPGWQGKARLRQQARQVREEAHAQAPQEQHARGGTNERGRQEDPRTDRRASRAARRAAATLGRRRSRPRRWPARRSTSFTTSSSTSQAGGHPDLDDLLRHSKPRRPGGGPERHLQRPEGVFGNPNAITQCTSADFALEQCPPNSQAGLITITPTTKATPTTCSARRRSTTSTQRRPDRALRLHRADPRYPDPIPVAVRTGTDYGLRFTVSEITQLTPLAGADLTFWGFPAAPNHDAERFPKGAPGEPAGCPDLDDTSCIATPTPASIPMHPLTDNPTVCTGEPLPTTLEVQTYQDPDHLSTPKVQLPGDRPNAKTRPSSRSSTRARPPRRPTPPRASTSSSTPRSSSASPRRPRRSRSATVTLPRASRSTPTPPTGRRACTDAQANFGSEGPAECPDNSKIGTFAIGSPALDGPLEGSIYIGEPKPGDQYRLFLIASRLRHQRQAGRLDPARPGDRPADRLLRRPAAGPVRRLPAASLRLRPRPDGDPDPLHGLPSTRDFFPWNRLSPTDSNQNFGLELGPARQPLPGRGTALQPDASSPAPRTPTAGAFSSFTLKLDREDGDQFLGKLNFTMPPGLTGDLRGITYCPEAAIAAAAQNPGRTEQATPSCPASLADRHHQRRRRPRLPPLPRGREDVPRRALQGRPALPRRRSPRPSPGPTTTARSSSASRSTSTPTTPSHRRLRNGAEHHRRHPDPDALDPGQHRQAQLHDQPDQLLALHGRLQGIGDQGTVADFTSYFQAVNCATLPFKPKMTMRQLGGRKADQARHQPRAAVRPHHPPRRRQHQIALGHPSERLRDRPAPSRQHLLRERTRPQPSAPGAQPIGKATTTTPLLDQPLPGPVYAVSGSGGLPRLAFILDGQVDLVPRAETKTITGGRLQTTVPVVPDAPIGHFHLVVFGGKKGYLVNTRDLCAPPPVTAVAYVAQNGKSRIGIRQGSGPPLRQGVQARPSATLAESPLRLPLGAQRRAGVLS